MRVILLVPNSLSIADLNGYREGWISRNLANLQLRGDLRRQT